MLMGSAVPNAATNVDYGSTRLMGLNHLVGMVPSNETDAAFWDFAAAGLTPASSAGCG